MDSEALCSSELDNKDETIEGLGEIEGPASGVLLVRMLEILCVIFLSSIRQARRVYKLYEGVVVVVKREHGQSTKAGFK